MTLLVPYRDRQEHLKEFIAGMKQHEIFIIEQADKKPFNRGKLINVGFLEVLPERFAAHDIDMIDRYVDYYSPGKFEHSIIQLARSEIQQVDYLGGVTLYTNMAFRHAGGYHNDFWHRAEDNEMRFNLRRKNYHVQNRFGYFTQLAHERPAVEFDPVLWQKAQLPRTKDMLKTCEYKLISKEFRAGYTHLKVEL